MFLEIMTTFGSILLILLSVGLAFFVITTALYYLMCFLIDRFSEKVAVIALLISLFLIVAGVGTAAKIHTDRLNQTTEQVVDTPVKR